MHPCARCASLQKTCCQRAEILVTDGDIHRISTHTNRTDFFEFRKPQDPAYLDQDDDPNWLPYTVEPDGTRRVLKRQPNLDCTFLGPHGCILPLETRPIVCRLYPYSYTEGGIDGSDEDYCPTAVLAPPGSGLTMLTVLGMNLTDAQRWHTQLYAELRARRDRERTHTQSPQP